MERMVGELKEETKKRLLETYPMLWTIFNKIYQKGFSNGMKYGLKTTKPMGESKKCRS